MPSSRAPRRTNLPSFKVILFLPHATVRHAPLLLFVCAWNKGAHDLSMVIGHSIACFHVLLNVWAKFAGSFASRLQRIFDEAVFVFEILNPMVVLSLPFGPTFL